jgi:hypothetical protein
MARATPNSLCTKWVAISDAMTDEEHAVEDAKMAEAHARHGPDVPQQRRIQQL